MKKTVASFLCLALGLALIPAASANAYAESADAVIYAVDSWAEPYLTIPTSLAGSCTITSSSGATSFHVERGESAEVSESGVVTPHYETCYWYGSTGYTVIQPGRTYDKTTRRVKYGVTEIAFLSGGRKHSFSVEVRNYADVYAEAVIDGYIAKNIPQSMPFYEKLEKICQLPARYNYDMNFSHAPGMIITGGGDCWASTDVILRMCKKLGIEAKERNAGRDWKAGAGHRNALITKAPGDYYELEAGFNQKAPRTWQVFHRTSLLCCRNCGDCGLEVYQYDGEAESTTELIVPQKIDGKTVLAIGKSFVSRLPALKKVVLPPTIVSIGDDAFYFCTALESLQLPASVKSIGKYAFANCRSLTDFTCDPKNPYMAIENGVLFDKQMKRVIAAPACSEAVLPDTVNTVGDHAFYYNGFLTSVSLGAETKTVEEGAFSNCHALKEANLAAVNVIGKSAFEGCKSLKQISIPATVEKIGNLAFSLSGLTSVSISAGINEIGKNAFYGCPITDIYFSGTEEQWNLIGKTGCGIAKGAVLHFNYSPEKGDVNIDGKIDNIDSSLILKYDSGIYDGKNKMKSHGDVNNDGTADNLDAAQILKYDAGVIGSL